MKNVLVSAALLLSVVAIGAAAYLLVKDSRRQDEMDDWEKRWKSIQAAQDDHEQRLVEVRRVLDDSSAIDESELNSRLLPLSERVNDLNRTQGRLQESISTQERDLQVMETRIIEARASAQAAKDQVIEVKRQAQQFADRLNRQGASAQAGDGGPPGPGKEWKPTIDELDRALSLKPDQRQAVEGTLRDYQARLVEILERERPDGSTGAMAVAEAFTATDEAKRGQLLTELMQAPCPDSTQNYGETVGQMQQSIWSDLGKTLDQGQIDDFKGRNPDLFGIKIADSPLEKAMGRAIQRLQDRGEE